MRRALNILVIEDETIIAMQIRKCLSEIGHRVIGPFPNVDRGREALDSERVDLALLDIQLGEERVFPLAEALESRRIPFMFITGYGSDVLPPALTHRPCIVKPFDTKELLTRIETLVA